MDLENFVKDLKEGSLKIHEAPSIESILAIKIGAILKKILR
jgi:hypothetical protein